jgi:hypothetical protein
LSARVIERFASRREPPPKIVRRRSKGRNRRETKWQVGPLERTDIELARKHRASGGEASDHPGRQRYGKINFLFGTLTYL